MSDTNSDIDAVFGCFFWACGIIFVGFLVFMFTVVGPSHDQRREACDAKGGVLVGKYGDCIKKEYVLKY